MGNNRSEQICVNLTAEQCAKIEELAKKSRHKKSEIAFFIISDYLEALEK